jgi:hypothetical protein
MLTSIAHQYQARYKIEQQRKPPQTLAETGQRILQLFDEINLFDNRSRLNPSDTANLNLIIAEESRFGGWRANSCLFVAGNESLDHRIRENKELS